MEYDERKKALARKAFDNLRDHLDDIAYIFKKTPLYKENKGNRIQRRLTLYLTEDEQDQLEKLIEGTYIRLYIVGDRVTLRIDRYCQEIFMSPLCECDKYDGDDLPNTALVISQHKNRDESEYLDFYSVTRGFVEKKWDYEKIKHFIYMGYFDIYIDGRVCTVMKKPFPMVYVGMINGRHAYYYEDYFTENICKKLSKEATKVEQVHPITIRDKFFLTESLHEGDTMGKKRYWITAPVSQEQKKAFDFACEEYGCNRAELISSITKS